MGLFSMIGDDGDVDSSVGWRSLRKYIVYTLYIHIYIYAHVYMHIALYYTYFRSIHNMCVSHASASVLIHRQVYSCTIIQ